MHNSLFSHANAQMLGLNRRKFISLLATSAAGGVMMTKTGFAQGNDTSLLLSEADVCSITPEVTEGPYYFDPQLVRKNITEGRPGVPMLMRMQVVDSACQPIPDARVDIWHCGADGLYSNYAGQGDRRNTDTSGETFFRGAQMANSSGVVEFKTVYPGWYSGRTTHIHFKVFLDETNVLTGQVFFPDALSEFIYENVDAYTDRAYARDTYNANDTIAKQATYASFADIKELEETYVASLIVGVNPDATSGGFSFSGDQNANGQRRQPPQGNGEPRNSGPGNSGQGGPQGGPTGTADRSTLVPSS